jgi:hypothetical protein
VSVRHLIFGSRGYAYPGAVAEFVMALSADTVVVTGVAPGVDSWAACAAHYVCRCANPCRHVEGDPEFVNLLTDDWPAEWTRYGKSAGPRRNAAMVASKPDIATGFWDGMSRGTLDCAEKIVAAGVLLVDGTEATLRKRLRAQGADVVPPKER